MKVGSATRMGIQSDWNVAQYNSQICKRFSYDIHWHCMFFLCCMVFIEFYCGWWFQPLWKNMKVSWDDYSQYMGKKTTCSKPPTRYIYIYIIYIQNYISNLWKHCKVYQGINHILVLPFILNHPEARGIIGLSHDPGHTGLSQNQKRKQTQWHQHIPYAPCMEYLPTLSYIYPQKWPKCR